MHQLLRANSFKNINFVLDIPLKCLQVKPDCVDVLFVDYGNTETLKPDELRKQICMGDISIQCHRCVTTGIIPVSNIDHCNVFSNALNLS